MAAGRTSRSPGAEDSSAAFPGYRAEFSSSESGAPLDAGADPRQLESGCGCRGGQRYVSPFCAPVTGCRGSSRETANSTAGSCGCEKAFASTSAIHCARANPRSSKLCRSVGRGGPNSCGHYRVAENSRPAAGNVPLSFHSRGVKPSRNPTCQATCPPGLCAKHKAKFIVGEPGLGKSRGGETTCQVRTRCPRCRSCAGSSTHRNENFCGTAPQFVQGCVPRRGS